MHERKERYFASGSKLQKGKRQALLDVLLQLQWDTNQLSEEDVLDEVNSFALAVNNSQICSKFSI